MTDNIDDLLKTVSQFNIEGWNNLTPDQIKISRIGDGYINTTSKIERADGKQDGQTTQMIYKIYGGNLMFDTLAATANINSPLFQSLIAFELSNRKWGPTVYGLTEKPAGRFEEFIDCHTLGQGEAFQDEELSADLAKALARFHSLDLPLPRGDPCPLGDLYKNIVSGKDQLVQWLSENKQCEHREYLVALSQFAMVEEADWFIKNCSNISHRVVFAAVDGNYLNRLVREKKPTDPQMTRCLIIDYDISVYCHRGVDLGGHFTNRLFNWSDKKNKVSGYNFPTESERKHFIEAYLREYKNLSCDFDERSLDSLDQVMMEADLYSAGMLLWLLSFFIDPGKTYSLEPQMVTFIKCAIENYKRIKAECCKKYPQFVS